MNQRIGIYIGLFLVFALGGVALIIANNTSDSVALSNTFNESTAFEVRYPEAWVYQIPVANVFVVAPDVVLRDNTPGPSVTIQRATTFEAGGEALDVILTTFLERNQLAGEDANAWEQISDIRETEISGQPALTVEYRGSNTAEDPVSWVEISVMLAENTEMVYFIFASVPETLYDEFEETIHAIVESIEIKE